MGQGSFFAELEESFARHRDRQAIYEPRTGRSLSYAELEASIGAWAARLAAAGLVPGERVAVQVQKSLEALLLYLACLRSGLIFLPLNPAYTAGELEHMLTDAEPALFVTDPAREAELAPLARRHGVRLVWTLDAAGRARPWDAREPAPPPPPPVKGEDIAALLYTSGTTGRPKGAPLAHRNLASNARVLVEAWGFTAEDVLLHALPIFHVHGLFIACHCALLAGARMLWLPRFEAEEVVRLLPEATVFMGVPTMYVRLLEQPELTPERCRRMRLFISGSAPLPAQVWHAFKERTGHEILERYGMSEILMHTGNPLHGERRPGTVGRPFPGSEVKIVDERGRALAPGRVGEVLVRGPNVFSGYWRRPQLQREVFTEDGWFRTGDLGYLSEDGYLTLVGRSKDLIITGGLNVYPKEVEEVLDSLPGVRESAVFGLPHPDFGEAVTAAVVPEPGSRWDERRLIAALKARLAGFKVPKRILRLDELPRNSMGKIQKRVLRERFRRLYLAPEVGS